MSSWLDGPMAPYDLETTGVDVFTDRIVSFCVGRVGRGIGTATRVGIVNPGVPIPEAATAIHGITDQRAQQGQDARTAVDHIAGELAAAMLDLVPVVGWNVVYDLSLLRAECERYGLPTVQDRLGRPDSPVIDGLLLDKQTDRYRKGSRRLIDVARHYGVELSDVDAHGAEFDALAAARVAWKIGARHPAVGRLNVQELHNEQVGWAAEQAASFRSYLIKQGKPCDDVTGEWPVRLTPQTVPA